MVIGIIGIVAAIIIPAVINNTNKIEFANSFKKSYSELTNAYNLFIQDGGGDEIDPSIYALGDVNTTAKNIRDALCTKLKCVETCNSGGNCFFKTTNEFSTYSGVNPGWGALLGQRNATLLNGAMFSVNAISPSCNGAGPSAKYPWTCGWLTIDTNGFKAPNRMGLDIFRILIYRNGIVPDGILIDFGYCDPASANIANGIGCPALILQNKPLP